MTRKEVSNRFNALPENHRATIIGNELEQEIRWCEREKRSAIKAHQQNISKINDRINTLEKSLTQLK